MNRRCRLFPRVLQVLTWAGGLWSASCAECADNLVTPDELLEMRRWVAAKFEGVEAVPVLETGLTVRANNDPVQKNQRAGRPLKIKDKQYTHGLYCHAVSDVLVRLPGPGERLTAVIGVDSNSQTVPGRGSVVFSVEVAGREAFRSELLREGLPGVPITVALGGAQEIVLKVSDGGDGISCDQADWADAEVLLRDGSVIRLGDLPLLDIATKPYSTDPPFSLRVGGVPLGELLAGWQRTLESRALDDRRTQHTLTYTDPQTELVARCVAIEYRDFPTVEWTLYLRNNAATDAPLVSDILPMDTVFYRSPAGEFVLHHQTGSPCLPTDYQPFATRLEPSSTRRIAAAGGRPTNSDLPYFNLHWLDQGVIVVVGWPGQWAAEFERDPQQGLHVRAGQERTHLRLRPGEEIRTPLMVLQFWKGDRQRAQNVWRRWMIAHNLPRPGGNLPPVQLAACSSHQFGEMIHADSASQKLFVDRYLAEGLQLDYWWMDAGWYWNKTGWPNVGTWEVDTQRFPGGLRPICDHAHAKGVKTIVWFEPERVTPGTRLYDEHPDWLLGPDGGTKLLNLGHPQARQWLTDHIDRLLTREGIDLYRQDFNIDPLEFWHAADTEDRQGITEIRYVEGYLAYWDELRRRHPDMLIDSCASGGRRNDLETLRRAVPLLRSDYIMEPVGNQCHTYGIAFWYPYYGTGTGSGDINPYLLRSVMCPHFTACFDVRRTDLDYAMIRRVMGQWREFAGYYYGDYYPLTSYSLATDVWMAWQFHSPEQGAGLIQAFRRADSYYDSARFPLHGLEPHTVYAVTDLDTANMVQMTGRELSEQGLSVAIAERPGSAVITYKKLDQ
ncbi:MAG: alpha-galactosidase [Pirellulaceae bacterium]|nr:alpha-galactosidase [Pirellulaceae bacterium]